MRVLSLFDGISCAQESLRQAGLHISEYVAVEIDEAARLNTFRNFPETRFVKDVLGMPQRYLQKGRFDLLVAGSPCQGFSMAGKMLAFEDPRSKLYFEVEKIRELVQPRYFLLENVKMKAAFEQVITDRLGVGSPLNICASQVSPIRRPRRYWTNFAPSLPETWLRRDPRLLEEYLDLEIPPGPESRTKWPAWWEKRKEFQLRKRYCGLLPENGVAITQTARQAASWNINVVQSTAGDRWATPEELERLHGLPAGFTEGMSRGQRYKALGNGWAVQVTRQILGWIKRAEGLL
jgi:site-specific DNA-cytosine methylase